MARIRSLLCLALVLALLSLVACFGSFFGGFFGSTFNKLFFWKKLNVVGVSDDRIPNEYIVFFTSAVNDPEEKAAAMVKLNRASVEYVYDLPKVKGASFVGVTFATRFFWMMDWEVASMEQVSTRTL